MYPDAGRPRMLRPVLIVLALATLALAGCSGSTSTDHQVVEIRDSNFNPSTVNIAPGQSVEFHNAGSLSHTVTIHDPAAKQVKDTVLTPGQSTSYTFSGAGAYHVFCRFHEGSGMAMTVNAK